MLTLWFTCNEVPRGPLGCSAGYDLTSNEELYKAMLHHRITNGAIPGPVEAWLGLRGLRTLRCAWSVP